LNLTFSYDVRDILAASSLSLRAISTALADHHGHTISISTTLTRTLKDTLAQGRGYPKPEARKK
jgi:hypothetical protein